MIMEVVHVILHLCSMDNMRRGEDEPMSYAGPSLTTALLLLPTEGRTPAVMAIFHISHHINKSEKINEALTTRAVGRVWSDSRGLDRLVITPFYSYHTDRSLTTHWTPNSDH